MELIITKRTNPLLLSRMKNHYSSPRGFVGRNICYGIFHDGSYYGHIVGGSATRFLPNRNEFLGIDISNLNNIVNNIFFNISPVGSKYPTRNFTTKCVEEFVKKIKTDWLLKYGDRVLGFETLVEKPRTGELYRRAGWTLIGETHGYTCKRASGIGTDSYTGRRVWNTSELRPKLVFAYRG
jgi:hypothetical protein